MATKRSAGKSAKTASAKKAAKRGTAGPAAPKKAPPAAKTKSAPEKKASAPAKKPAPAKVPAKPAKGTSAKAPPPPPRGASKPSASARAGRPSEAGPSVAKAIPTGPSGKPLTKAPNAAARPTQSKTAPGASKSAPPAARGGLAPAPRGGLSRPGGRALPPKPRIDGGLAGGEKIVLVPARASETAAKSPGPRSSLGSKARSAGEREAARAAAAAVAPPLPLPVRKRDAPMTFEERAASIEKRLAAQSEEFRTRYWDSFYMSWIYHDSALEGVVYTYDELRTALAQSNPAKPPPVTPQPPPAPASQPGLPPEEMANESNIQPACEEIRRHREALDHIRDYAKKKGPITIDVIKKIYLILHPEEGDLKTVKYRRDIPQHRLYFHEYAQPDKIAYKVRQVVDWLNDPETKKGRNALRIAARAHYDLLRVFPFQSDSGKVARMFMNLLLLRAGLPPSIIHSAERQRYYDALKGSANQILSMVQESVENAVLSVEKLLDEHEAKLRSPLP